MVGYYVIPSEPFECLSICLSFHPSVRCFRTLTWVVFDGFSSNFALTFDIGKEWFGIVNGLYSIINNRVMALDWCKNVFFLNIFIPNGWILIKFCICIDIYKVHVVSNAQYFWLLWPLMSEFCLCLISCELICGFRSNFVYALILTRCRFWWLNYIFRSFLIEWLMSKFHLCSISCGPIDGFW